LPPEARIATTSAGLIPFFCDRPCLDLHGLTDAEIARQRLTRRDRGRMGHEHWLQDTAAIRGRGVDVVLEWADPNLYPRAMAAAPYEHSWHTKLLRYPAPLDGVRLQDEGRRIYGSASWTVHDVDAGEDLVLIARTDHTGGGTYDVEINGEVLPQSLVTPWWPN